MACCCGGGTACGRVCSMCGFTGADLCLTIETPSTAFLRVGQAGPEVGVVACLLGARNFRVPWVGYGWQLQQRLPGCGLTNTDSNHPVFDFTLYCEPCEFRATRGVYRDAMRVVMVVSSASQVGGGLLSAWPAGASPGNAYGVPAYFAVPCGQRSGDVLFDQAIYWNGSVGAGNNPAVAGRITARACGGVSTRDAAQFFRAGLGAPRPQSAAPQSFASAAPAPPCRYRGEDALPAGEVAAEGQNPGRDHYRCERPDFERLGLAVSECQSCGVPEGRRCGAASGCGGYEPAAPEAD